VINLRHNAETTGGFVVTESPGRLATWESDLAVPVGQAVAVGLAVALASGTVTVLLGGPVASLAGRELWSWAGRIAGTAGALSGALAVLAFVRDHRRQLWRREQYLDRDLDGDGVIGQPEPETVRIELITEDGRHRRYLDLPVGDDKLKRLAVAVLYNRKPWSRRELAAVLSQGEYAKLSDALLDAGALRETPTGRELTPSGRAILKHYV